MDDLEHIETDGNFWDVGNYKVVLKRINTGAKLCDELVKMLNERCGDIYLHKRGNSAGKTIAGRRGAGKRIEKGSFLREKKK